MKFTLLSSVLAASSLVAAQGNSPTVSQAVFNDIITYSGFAAASYANTCNTPQNGSKVVKYFNDNFSDTQATLFTWAAGRKIILALRGTSTPKDAATDLAFALADLSAQGTDCGDCKVHRGFQKSWVAIQKEAIAAVNSAKAANPSYDVIVTGHSLGGGIAAIAAGSLAALGTSVTVYTYGEPRNGNAAWGNYISGLVPDARYFRVTHSNDGVPRIPPKVLSYVHHGTEYWQKPDRGVAASNTYKCAGTEPAFCNSATNFGQNPINNAHITYSNNVIGNALYIAACGNAPRKVI